MLFGFNKIVVLRAQEFVALLGFFVFFDGHQVDRAHLIDAPLQSADLFGDYVPVGGNTGGGHFFGRKRLHFCGAFVGDGDGDAFAANVVEDKLVFLLNALAQVLHRHAFLGHFDIESAALLLEFREPATLSAQLVFAGLDRVFLDVPLGHQFSRLCTGDFALVPKALDLAAGFFDFGEPLFFAGGEAADFISALLREVTQLGDALLERLLLLA